MKRIAFVLLLISCIAFACSKEMKYPERTLIGLWYSNDPILQFPIENTTGQGKSIQFLQFKQNDKDYLKVTYPEGVDTYQIKWIGKNELVLVDTSGKDINFVRIVQ